MTEVVIFSSEHDDPKKLMSGAKARATSIPISELEENIAQIGPAISGVVSKLKETALDLGLTEISLSIGINGKGKVGFLGTGAEVGGDATISLKFKV